MKKNGFVLAETLVVVIFVLIIFALLYNTTVPLIGKYEQISYYDDLDTTYDVYQYKRIIAHDATSKDYLIIPYTRVNCSNLTNEKNRCENLSNFIDIKNGDSLLYINTNFMNEMINDNSFNVRDEIKKYLEYTNWERDKTIILLEHDEYTSYVYYLELPIYTIGYTLVEEGFPDELLRPITMIGNRASYTFGTETFKLNDPSRLGYDFDGWTTGTENESTLNVTTATKNLPITKGTYGNIALNANWTAHVYDIEYTLNGGNDPSPKPPNGTYDETVEIGNPTKTFTVNIVRGKNGEGTTIQNSSGANVTSASSTQTFAGWTADNTLSTATALYGDTRDRTKIKTPWNNNTTKVKNKYFMNLRTGNGDKIKLTANWTAVDVQLPKISKTGYLCGYSETENGTKKYENESKYTPPTTTNNQTLYAVCEPIKYNISYELNGGNDPSPKPTKGTYDHTVEIGTPTKKFTVNIGTGKNGQGTTIQNSSGANVTSASSVQTFAGWTADSSLSTSTAKYGDSSNPNNITTAWSNYTTKVTNKYFKNLKTGEGENIKLTENWTAVNVQLPKISKTGYTCGYATSSTSDRVYESEASYTPSTTINNITLYSSCTPNKYTVTLDMQGGSGGTGSVTATFDSDMPSATAPTRTGYSFGGYYTGTSGTGTNYYNSSMGSVRKWDIASNTTLYAKWTPITYDISYDGNGDTGGSTGTSTHTYGVAKNLTANGYQKKYTVTYNYNNATGGNGTPSSTVTYTFAGWTYAGNTYSNQQSVKNVTSTPGTLTFKAKWTGGGSVTLPSPTRTGYTFAGWYNGSTRVGGAGDGYTPTGSVESVKLTASWTAITYTITYELNGGTNHPNNPNSYSIESDSIILKAPTKDGYTFAGWTGTDLSERTILKTILKGSTGNRTYTANWKLKKSFDFRNPVTVYGTDTMIFWSNHSNRRVDAYANLSDDNINGNLCWKAAIWNDWNGQDPNTTYWIDTKNSNNAYFTGPSHTFAGHYFNRSVNIWNNDGSFANELYMDGNLQVHIYECQKTNPRFVTAFTFKIFLYATYDGNGGSNLGSKKFGLNGSVPLDDVASRSGYAFLGWSPERDGDIATSVYSSEDITLYAQWSKALG